MNSKTRAALVGGLLGVIFGAMISSSTAHTPCGNRFDEIYNQPQCKYVQVVNPYTGQLETQYVCK